MVSAYRQTAVFILLMNETGTVSLQSFVLPSDCTESKDSPSRGICPELPMRPLGNSSIRQQAAREFALGNLLERRE
jgi:hypothetical protein